FISFINLSGLTIGLTCCLLILAYIINELSYDKYNKNADNIYRVTRSFNNQDGVVSLNLSTIAPAFGPYLLTDFPDIQKMTRVYPQGATAIHYGDKIFNEPDVYCADENFFSVFTQKMVVGNPKTALAEPFSIILTEEAAKKYFGNEDPMNKTLRLMNLFNLKVTGIYKRFPENSFMHPEVLMSFSTLNDTAVYGAENLRTSWGNNSFFTFIQMPEKYPMQNMEKQFPAFVDRHMPHSNYNGKNPSLFTKLGLQKLTDIHLKSHTDYEAEANGDMSRVYIFGSIALFILLIACINYMNLSTARSALRAREIGIRKVIGARKKELVSQFLSESVLICWFALIIALLLTWLALPWLNKTLGQHIFISSLFKWQILIPLFLSPFIVGILSGIYPALFMSSFQPIKTLKGLFKSSGGISFRKVLVVTQFAISIVLIITTAIVFQQLSFMQKKSLGFNKDQVLIIPNNVDIDKNYIAFRNELLRNSSFKDVSRSSRVPSIRLLDNMGASTLSGDSMRPTNTDIKYVAVDYDFIPTYGIQIASGRNFSRDFGTDTSGYVLNEAAVKALGWNAQNAIGKDFKYGNQKGKIIGVVNDFHFESMHQQIVPLVMLMFPPSINQFNFVSVKIAGGSIQSALNHLETTWRRLLADEPYEFNFLDEKFGKLYESEQKQGTIFVVFACIAIFIASLGLFGLSAFTITQRVKEIGVRKVLGASVGSIVMLLSKEFLKLVLIASIIAFLVASITMYNWLNDFAYRINIYFQWWVFLLAGVLAAMIALVTVSFQAIKAATANPVKSLRTE
ncbi:MAG TPA: ABC transporter permease, partial [Puia sp.]|nr:ABC transporter permease [Puia sp.]